MIDIRYISRCVIQISNSVRIILHAHIDLVPYMSRIHHQLRSKKTRGPDVAASVSRLIFMRCHDNVQSDTPQSNPECRTDITIRARTVYTPNVTYVIDNDILLRKLKCYGIRRVVNSWFESYLSSRMQFVEMDNCK